MGERTLDALAGIVFIIIVLGLQYLNWDIGLAKSFIWVFAILFHSYMYGKRAFPDRHWTISWSFGLLLLMSVQSIAQTLWFYAGGQLGALSDAWCLVLAMAIAHLSGLATEQNILAPETAEEVTPIKWTRKKQVLAASLSLSGLSILAFILHNAWIAKTFETIRTPWPLLATGTLAAIFLLWTICALSASYIRSSAFTMLHAVLAMVGTLAIAPIIYRMGFGFDGFLHLAGQQVLLKTGFLEPKPFYYIGQYVFTTWLTRVTELPLVEINRWLGPLLTAVLLPVSFGFAFKRDRWFGQAAMITALLPLSLFVATTPQGLAIVLGVSALALAWGARKKALEPSAPFWISLWSVTIHPLAGIPLFVLVLTLLYLGNRKTWKKHLIWPMAIASGIAIPLVFYWASQYQNALAIDWNLAQAGQLSALLGSFAKLIPWLGNKYAIWPAWSSLIGLSLPALGLTACIASIITLKDNDRLAAAVLLIGALTLMAASGILENASDFTFLIQYEKGDYAQRLWQIATMILLIGGVPAIGKMFDRLRTALPIGSAVAIILLGSIGAANAYNSLPRHDAVQASRGWSMSAQDVEAVRWIDRYAKGKDYTVLANQTVSSAAVKEFGFKRYAGDVFFYPIPTGGPLYQAYLKMTYEDPSLDTVKDAAKLGKTDLVFVVINDYWWKAEELNQKIGEIADDSWKIGNNKVNIYVFDLSKTKATTGTTT